MDKGRETQRRSSTERERDPKGERIACPFAAARQAIAAGIGGTLGYRDGASCAGRRSGGRHTTRSLSQALD